MRQKTGKKPFFIITIDNEGDNQWSRPRNITTENANYLPRFQNLCESYGLRPTYLTNYEMALSLDFQRMGKEIVKNKTGEIGMHLHPWNSPPLVSVSEDDYRHHPYLIEYPEKVMFDKVKKITNILEDKFGVKMLSHRAGRWAFNETYARILIENGYIVDCSVTPHVSWKDVKGHPDMDGGSDYRKFPDQAYYLDCDNIRCPGTSRLLEVPMTISVKERPIKNFIAQKYPPRSLIRRGLNRLFPEIYWLRPNGRNRRSMLRLVKQAVKEKRDYVEFMLHSSEFMPGENPTFKNGRSIESLYCDLEKLFRYAQKNCYAATMSEFADWFCKN